MWWTRWFSRGLTDDRRKNLVSESRIDALRDDALQRGAKDFALGTAGSPWLEGAQYDFDRGSKASRSLPGAQKDTLRRCPASEAQDAVSTEAAQDAVSTDALASCSKVQKETARDSAGRTAVGSSVAALMDAAGCPKQQPSSTSMAST